MADLLRSEWIKFHTVRVNYVLGIIAAAFPIIVTGLVVLLMGDVDEAADGFVGGITGTMVLSSLLLGVIGALNLTSEYSHGTIRTTFAATPQRVRVLVAKAIVTLLATLVIAAVIEAATYIVDVVILEARDARIDVTGSDRAALVGAVVLSGMLAMLGYGLGLLIRNSPATVTILILWPLLLEQIVRGVLAAAGVENQTGWLPYQSAISMANPEPSAGDPSRLHGGLYLGGVVLVLIIVGIFVNDRRDA
jgi:ABC-2 type transport system permease protein